jgi:hypothetical protein
VVVCIWRVELGDVEPAAQDHRAAVRQTLEAMRRRDARGDLVGTRQVGRGGDAELPVVTDVVAGDAPVLAAVEGEHVGRLLPDLPAILADVVERGDGSDRDLSARSRPSRTIAR